MAPATTTLLHQCHFNVFRKGLPLSLTVIQAVGATTRAALPFSGWYSLNDTLAVVLKVCLHTTQFAFYHFKYIRGRVVILRTVSGHRVGCGHHTSRNFLIMTWPIHKLAKHASVMYTSSHSRSFRTVRSPTLPVLPVSTHCGDHTVYLCPDKTEFNRSGCLHLTCVFYICSLLTACCKSGTCFLLLWCDLWSKWPTYDVTGHTRHAKYLSNINKELKCHILLPLKFSVNRLKYPSDSNSQRSRSKVSLIELCRIFNKIQTAISLVFLPTSQSILYINSICCRLQLQRIGIPAKLKSTAHSD